MFVPVDTTQEDIEGFSYTNQYGHGERVRIIDKRVAKIEEADGSVAIWIDDIPKLIKALQAAYDHVNKEGN